MKTTKRSIKKAALIAAGISLMLTSFTGCFSFGSTYRNADKYSAGDLDYSGEITELDINWSSGSVNVSYYDGENVSVTESCKKDLSDAKKVHTWVDGKTLHIQFSKSGEAFVFEDYKKELEVKLPKDTKLSKVSYDGSSADTVFDEIKAEEFDIDTSSGNVSLNSCEADEVTADTSSGNITIDLTGDCDKIITDASSGDVTVTAGEVKTAKFDSSSGKIKADLKSVDELSGDSSSGNMTFKTGKTPSKMSLDTSSGDVTLYLPEDGDFTIEVDTSSGDFESELSMSKKGDTYSYGSGDGRISIDTSSGDITIKQYSKD